MVLLTPRIHWYEINDQSWFPSYLRAKVQAGLTLMWTVNLPIIQPSSPGELVAATLQRVLGKRISDYTFVDFCAGAGGPTPYIEKDLNARLGFTKPPSKNSQANGNAESLPVSFVLTDIAPHIEAWEEAQLRSPTQSLQYIDYPIDATNAPRDFLSPITRTGQSQKVFRLFFLAFHHFDDPLATKILENSIDTSDGFAIFELQHRTFSSLLTCTLMWPLLLLISPYYFWRDPGFLFFTYIIPIIPFVLVVDGYTSSLRTRTADEIQTMMGGGGKGGIKGWKFRSGSEVHTYPIGEMSWFIGVKES
ncbi:hypothetical protein MMC11_004436 [Xylographa trunciseda]|nr:hypothetical protein [Xylographa trunciseda]